MPDDPPKHHRGHGQRFRHPRRRHGAAELWHPLASHAAGHGDDDGHGGGGKDKGAVVCAAGECGAEDQQDLDVHD